MTDLLIAPYGGHLVDLLVAPEHRAELMAYAGTLPSLQVSDRVASGAFSPLDRFVGRHDYQRVLAEMRLTSGHIFPVPVTLPVDPEQDVHLDQDVVLRSPKNDVLAILTIEEIYAWDPDALADDVFGTRDLRHPLVLEMRRWGRLNVAGRLRVLKLPAAHLQHQRMP